MDRSIVYAVYIVGWGVG